MTEAQQRAFLESPLVVWVKALAVDATASCDSIDDLADGIYLNEIVCSL